MGPRLFRTGPIILEHGALRNRWIVVQDSTMGVVFTEPSGVKVSSPDYDGDVDLKGRSRLIHHYLAKQDALENKTSHEAKSITSKLRSGQSHSRR